MRSRSEFIQEYAASHRHPLNQVIHMVCVPVIFFTSAGLLWSVPLAWLVPDVGADVSGWINLATVAALPIAIFYARLGLGSFVSGLAWMLLSALGCLAIGSSGAPLAWICLALWLVAWVVQIYGHRIEGAKPSFFDDLVFLLVGPLFVQDKFGRLLAGGSIRA